MHPKWGFFVYYAPFSNECPAFSDEIIDLLKTYIHCEVNDTDEADRGLPQQVRESLGLVVYEFLRPRVAPPSIDEIRRHCQNRILLSRSRPPLVPGVLIEVCLLIDDEVVQQLSRSPNPAPSQAARRATGWDEEQVFVRAIDLLYDPRDGAPESP
ncbi:hypothetical protein BO82DRAFT_425922 [Aspergillus uvarum CBS 121591]|uniref:Uncharacterized protein n=1 Tax=Aspergillus uvarum CBS 121591 TaxID=1448315 RepID=A0A319BYF8_9EURO|nr:hypothetical protein BO82DRAFT_425922 [Aspergillus uvarum CBS 121591]PYH76639.1 hypothetical protein BO82DRAFT_425922 [Aspergillus uvarum CBS 121591]